MLVHVGAGLHTPLCHSEQSDIIDRLSIGLEAKSRKKYASTLERLNQYSTYIFNELTRKVLKSGYKNDTHDSEQLNILSYPHAKDSQLQVGTACVKCNYHMICLRHHALTLSFVLKGYGVMI